MRKKKNTKSAENRGGGGRRAGDLFVVLFCLGGIVFCLRSFWNDLNRTISRQNEKPVGYITFKNRAAQRRFIDRVLWDRLQTESPIYNGDFIHTADLSEATITFQDGGIIELGENSSIQVFTGEGGARVDLQGGSVSADGQHGAISLHVSDTVVEVEGGAVSAAAGDEGLSLQVGAGSVTVKEGDEVKALGAGEFLADSGGSAMVGVVSPKPTAKLVLTGGERAAAVFRWSKVNFTDETVVFLEIAADRDFKREGQKLESEGDEETVNLEPGLWFWRAAAVERGTETLRPAALKKAVSGRITVTEEAGVEAVSPREGELFQYRRLLPPVRFQWTPSAALQETTSRYLLEVARNEAFNAPAVATAVEGASLVVSTLSAGTWYWRVRPVFPPGVEASLSTAPRGFTITQSDSLPPPVLTSPEDRCLLAVGSGSGDIRFSWKAENEAASYTVRISDNPGMNTSLVNEKVTSNYYIYRLSSGLLRERQYYWAVSQTDSQGTVSGFSAPRSVLLSSSGSITPLFPPNGHSVSESAIPKLKFNWRKTGTGTTKFQLSAAADFSALSVEEEVPGNEYRLSALKGGTYFWRLEVISPDGAQTLSPERTLTVVPNAAQKVRLEYPANGAHLRGGATENARWTSGEEVRSSRFFLRVDSNSASVPALMDVRNPGFSVPLGALEAGTYYWTVEAVSTGGADISAPESAMFIVDPPLLFAAPGNRKPENGWTFGTREAAEDKRISFAWDPVRGANRYVFTLYAVDGERRDQILQTVLSNPAYTFTDAAALKGKTFAWRVEAVSMTGSRYDQRGNAGENTFTLDIPVTKVIITNPGTLYGE